MLVSDQKDLVVKCQNLVDNIMAPRRRTIAPRFSSTGIEEPFLTGGDAATLALKNIIPVTELISSSLDVRRKRKQLPTKFSRAELGTLPARDLPRPSFALPARVPQGSSLAERVAGQKFGDAFQTAQETQFETQNELQKREQEARNLGITNQEELINTQIANREAAFNTQLLLRDFASDLGRRQTALEAVNVGLATDPSQLIQSQDIREMDRANAIVSNPDAIDANGKRLFSPEEVEAAQKLILGTRRSGGKTKFSY